MKYLMCIFCLFLLACGDKISPVPYFGKQIGLQNIDTNSVWRYEKMTILSNGDTIRANYTDSVTGVTLMNGKYAFDYVRRNESVYGYENRKMRTDANGTTIETPSKYFNFKHPTQVGDLFDFTKIGNMTMYAKTLSVDTNIVIFDTTYLNCICYQFTHDSVYNIQGTYFAQVGVGIVAIKYKGNSSTDYFKLIQKK
jgi:hypothetical protein